MLNEELYRSLYSKYAPNIVGRELEKKLRYAHTLNSTDFINSFYRKYTGSLPTSQQSKYINTIIKSKPKTTEQLDDTPFEHTLKARQQILLQTEEVIGEDEEGNPIKKLSVNKDFFNQEDEDVVAQLKIQFEDVFNFKEVIFDPEFGFSGVKISTKDGKHSKVIETNIDGRYEYLPRETIRTLEKLEKYGSKSLTDKEKNLVRLHKERDQAYETAFKDLTSFMDTHATDKTNIAIGKKEQKIRKDIQSFHEFTKVDIEAIENKYSKESQPDLFKPVKETRTGFKGYGAGGLGMGKSTYTYTVTKQPYEKELKLAQEILKIEPKDVSANMGIIQDKARQIIIENERRLLKELKTTEMLEELEDGEILPVSLQHYADDTDALKNVLAVGEKMFNKEYAVKAEEYARRFHELDKDEGIEAFIALSDKLRNPEYRFSIKEGEETVFLQDGREVPKALIEQYEEDRIRLKPLYEEFFRLQNDLIDNRYNIKDSRAQLDLLRRDYNDWDNFIVKTGLGFQELGVNIMGATDDMAAHKRWADVRREIHAKRAEYAKPIAFNKAFDNWTNFGKFTATEFANQISIFTSLAVPYIGWGTLLASTYGEQYGTMTAKEIKAKLSFDQLENHSDIKKRWNEMDRQNLIDLDSQSPLPSKEEWDNMSGEEREKWKSDASNNVGYSLSRKIATSTGYAVPEFVFEYLTTIPLLRSAGLALKSALGTGVRDQAKKGMYTVFKENAPTWATLSVAQSVGEGATVITQNIVTGKPWHLHVDHSMFSGLMFGTTLGSIPTVTGAMTSVLSDYTQNEEYRINLDEQNKLVRDNKNLDTKIRILKKRGKDGRSKEIKQAEADKKTNQLKIDELSNINDNILKNQKEGILGRWLGIGQDNRNGMGEGALKAYLDVTKEQEQIRLEAERIENSDGYSRDEKNRRLEKLRREGFTDANGKYYSPFGLLQNARDAFRNEKNNEFNQWKALGKNKVELDALIKEAQDYIDNPNSDRANKLFNFKGLKDKSPDNIARILWNIKKINKDLITPGRNTNLDNDLIVYQTVEEAVVKMKELGVDASVIQKVKDGYHGFDGPNNKSYITVENMAKDDRLEIKTHELSHRLLGNAISRDPRAFQEISDTVIEWAKENDAALHTRLLRSVARDADGTMLADEVIAVFLEEVAANRVNLKMDNIAGVFGFMASKVMKDKHGIDMDLAGQSDAIKLLIGLGKKLKAGKMTLKDVRALSKSEIIRRAKLEGKLLSTLAPTNVSKTKFSQSPDVQPTVKEDLFKTTNIALVEALKMYGIKDPERLLSEDIEVRKELAKEWESIGNGRFWIGAEIGKHWRTFIEVNYLSKRDKAANYDLYKDQILDVATTGIESGDNGIPFLVRSWKPAEEGGRTLTSHIFGEIETRLMATNGIIDRKFPQFDKFISVIDVATEGGIDIAGELGVAEVLEAERKKKERREMLEEDRFRKQIGIDNKFANEIKTIVKDVLLTGDLGLINEFAWTQRFSKAIQAQLFKTIKNEMKDFDAYLKRVRKPFMKHAHTSDLVQMEKNEAIKILAEKIAEDASPAEIKKALTEGLIQPFEVKSMTQGPNIYKKMDPSLQEFIDFMRVRGRKDALTKNIINVLSMDAVFDVLLNETVEVVDGVTGKTKTVPVLDEFIRIQREKGLPHVSNVLSTIKERINRDQDVKFSNTVKNFNNDQLAAFYNKLNVFGNLLNDINVGDEAAVYQAVYTVWNEDYNNTTLTALSKDMFRLVKRYATIESNHANLKTKPKEVLNEYLYNNLKAAELEVTLAEFLELKNKEGKRVQISKVFDEIGRINNMRNEPVVLGKNLVKKYGEEKALMMLIHASGMYATSTKISRGNFKVNEKGLVYRIQPKDIGKEKFTEQRYQVFTNKKDFNKHVLQKVFPDILLTEAGNLKKIQEVTVKGKKVKVDTSLLAEKSKEATEDRNFKARKAQAKLSEEFVLEMSQHYKDQIQKRVLDKTDFGMLMMSMASNMQSPLKRAANLKYIYKDKKDKKYKGELRYEHMIPTNFMVMKITDAFMSDKSKVDLDALFKEYTVAVIPVTMDNVLEEMGFQYVMPIDYLAGQSSRARYYNMSTFGHPDLYAIESIDPKDNGKIYGEAAANIKYSRNVKNTKVLTDAITKARTIKYSKESKGMSAWDFDDTIARTKSGVRYTLPNPEGIPQPSRKVIFMAGGPGSGKSTVIKGLDLENQGFKIVNQDISLQWLAKNHGLPTNMMDFTPAQASKWGELSWDARLIAKRKQSKFQGRGDGIIVDGTGNSLQQMQNHVQEFKNKGYDVQMVFVETSLETALERNRARKERSLRDSIVKRTHESVQNNKEAFRKLFGNNFTEVKTDNLKIGDPMPQSVASKVDSFTKGYIKGRLDAEEFANKGADLQAQGAKFDFTEFDIVKQGEKGPLFNKAMDRAKKYGLKDNYILTARPHAAQMSIFRFLAAQGLNIPFDNIITLENSTAEAKALWMAEKVGEGYNNIYFADDALQNVQAVQNMLDQFDVKSKTQQAKVKFSETMNTEFNKILEDVTGIESKKRFSAIKARKRGASKGKFRFFIPPSHEDFTGILYNFMGKGKKGDAHRNFFEKALIRPLNRAYRELNTAKQSIANDYKSLNKEFTNVKKKLTKKTPDGDFTYQDAIRVYLFDKHGHKIAGLNKTDQQKLVDLVMADTELQTYAETLNIISRQDTYVSPGQGWEAGDIRTDLDDATGRVGREQFFAEFNENAEIIFSQENLNKIEAAYGEDMVSAIKDILYRTKTGRNRPSGQNKLVNSFLQYLNGSVASTMFFNIRSAVLQQMSMVNFINFADNNIFSAAKAFANQPQYYKDWAYIFNSDFMKQRRGGIKTDVNGAELAASLRGAKNTPRALLAKLLQLGFLPTQIGDNIAIATGGSTFYRNRINTYLKQGLTQKEAESKAWIDFQVLAEATQQSARPDMVSQQQASPLGKVILAFQNVTSQFNRIGKKAFLDIKNRRITPGNTSLFQSDVSNLSRIGYYFAIQNLIFYSLQSALFAALYDDDEDDNRWLKKKERVINGSIDSVLRGAGVWGAVVATLKNMAIKWHAQREKGYNADESAVLMEMLNVSPPLGIKARKLVNAEKTLNYNKKVIDEMETFDIDNPMWSAWTNYIEATTNIPTNRLYNKTQNVRQALNNQHAAYERALMFSGWSQWNLGIEDEKMIKIKEDIKKKQEKKTKSKGRKTTTRKRSRR